MWNRASNSDATVLRNVNQRLGRAGLGSGCSVTVTVRNGDVTLSGSIQYEIQRRHICRAAEAADGTRSVVDRLVVQPANARRR